MRMMLKDILAKNGYEIAGEAENGRRAMELYQELKPDEVTMDITMPEMDPGSRGGQTYGPLLVCGVRSGRSGSGQAKLEHVPLDLAVVGREARITLREFLELQLGDVITLERAVNEDMEAFGWQ